MSAAFPFRLVLGILFAGLFSAELLASDGGAGRLPVSGTTYFVATNGDDAAPGSAERPWATLNHAASVARAGDRVVVHGGVYTLTDQVRPRASGRSDAWIEYIGSPGEEAVLDAQHVARPSPTALSNGAFQIEGASYIRVANLTVANSHDAGFTVRDASHVELINNTTRDTFSSGIAVWDTSHRRSSARDIRIIANTVKRANAWQMSPLNELDRSGPPHESISIGGAVDFEVAHNLVEDGGKEGIDIKETSSRGKVHHNLVRRMRWQGVYVDAWFGELDGIEVSSNVVAECHGAGIAISAENGPSVTGVVVSHNLVFANDGSGLYFSRWSTDNLRRNIKVLNNIFYRNGYGSPAAGQQYYWQPGGIYLYSDHLRDIAIENNIFAENRGFQIGYSELFLRRHKSWRQAARQQHIHLARNLFQSVDWPSSILSGGNAADRLEIHATAGEDPCFGDLGFMGATASDFVMGGRHLRVDCGAEALRHWAREGYWWKQNFPPLLVGSKL
jgi:hypothetical protein